MPNTKSHPIDSPHRKKKLKPKKTPASAPAISKRPKPRSGWPSFFFSSLLKVSTCYLALSYFYWCPQDPTQNPFVCRNLAQLHWALEPHLSPYLTQFNHHLRTPFQRRVDHKLRPFYDDYILPTWTRLSPQASKALELLKHSIHNSRAIGRASDIQSLYWTPIVQHVKQRYEAKLEPHVQLVITFTKQTYHVIRKSRLIRAVKSYLPHVQWFVVENIIQPIRDQVLPYLNKVHSQYVQPAIIRLVDSLYQYLFIHDNLLKQNFRSIKLAYRRRLLKPLKNLHEVYVRPQVKKIVSKLEEYQNRHNDSSIQVDRPTSSVTSHQPSHDAILAETPSDDRTEKSPRPSDQQSSPRPVADHLTKAPEEPVTAIPDRLANPSQGSDAPNYTGASSDSLDDQPAEPIIQAEKEQPTTTAEQTLDLQPDPPIDDESTDPEEVFLAEETMEVDLDLDEQFAQLYDDDESTIDDSSNITDTLTVDADEFMDEIKNEIASESEKGTPVIDDSRPNRKTPEEVAKERRRLEKIAADGFKRLAELKEEALENFIKAVASKRDEDNLRQHEEFMTRDRLVKIEKESEKLIKRLEKWFQRNEQTETKKMQEKLSEAELVVKKSKEKFADKLIHPHLVEIETYRKKEYQKELDIAIQAADPVSQYSTGIQSQLGFGFTWLSDVSHHDWAIYHQFRAESDAIKKTMEAIMTGEVPVQPDANHGPNPPSVPKPEFFSSIQLLKDSIAAAHRRFEDKLEGLYARHVASLQRLHQTRVTVDHPDL